MNNFHFKKYVKNYEGNMEPNENDPRYIEFKKYLESIGGLENGWFPSRKVVEPYYASIGIGWYPMVVDLIKELIDLGWDKEVCQIKEKFGGLRFYINSGSPEIFNAIDKAERKSYTICESCGEPGKARNDGWIVTLCNSCDDIRKKE